MLTLLAYFACSAYNLLWILHPRLALLRRLLGGCERASGLDYKPRPAAADWHLEAPLVPGEAASPTPGRAAGGRPTVRLEMYYDKRSRDFALLMDLLGESSGLVQPLRILAMFDKHFQALWRPRELRIHVDREQEAADFLLAGETGEGGEAEVSILVTWEDCAMADYMVSSGLARVLEYTLEIQPETEVPIKSFQYYQSPEGSGLLKWRELPQASAVSKYSARFDGLEATKSYTIHVATELEGKTVVQVPRCAPPRLTACRGRGSSRRGRAWTGRGRGSRGPRLPLLTVMGRGQGRSNRL
jgi:hypothetical protein